MREAPTHLDWLGGPADTFLDTDAGTDDTSDTAELIAHHPCSDQRLSPSAAEELAGMLQDMYTKLIIERPRIAVHMRSPNTFTPAAGNLLSEIVSDMQHTLEAEQTR